MTEPPIPPISGQLLVGGLGTFWGGFYRNRNDLTGLMTGLAALWGDTSDEIKLVSQCIDRHTAPVYAKRRLIPIVLNSTGRKTIPARYGSDNKTYLDGVTRYGQGLAGASYPAPDRLVRIGYISNRINQPTAVLLQDQDFDIRAGRILFHSDPQQNDLWPSLTSETGEQTTIMWAWAVEFDYDYAYRYAGYTVGVNLSTPERTKSVAVALGDSAAGGASVGRFLRAVGAITDSATADEDDTVELIGEDGEGWFVATTRTLYRLKNGMTPIVSAGDTVRYGDSLSSGFQYHSFNRGTTPEWVSVIILSPNDTGGQITGTLGFENTAKELTRPTIAGVPRVRFPVLGDPSVVDQFWEVVDAGEDESNQALYRLLSGGGGSLPPTIVPAAVLAQTFLRRGAATVELGGGANQEALSFVDSTINAHARILWGVNMTELSDLSVEFYDDFTDEQSDELGDLVETVEMLDDTPASPAMDSLHSLALGEGACFVI